MHPERTVTRKRNRNRKENTKEFFFFFFFPTLLQASFHEGDLIQINNKEQDTRSRTPIENPERTVNTKRIYQFPRTQNQ